MARIAGVNIPTEKRVVVSLTYIYGIGPVRAREICKALKFKDSLRTKDLTDQDIINIRNYIEEHFKVEGDVRRDVAMNIKRLIEIGCYRGRRHRSGLPVRGQRTKTNARTRKGPSKAVGGRKK